MATTPRRPIVAGNWKMNTTLAEAVALATALHEPLGKLNGVETVVCPPFISLAAVRDALSGEASTGTTDTPSRRTASGAGDAPSRGTATGLGAQNCHFEDKGAFTGEVSPAMLADLGCTHVILGHSERRQFFGETDEGVARKLRAAQAHGLTPIVCVGENLAQRESGETDAVVGGQVRAALSGLPAELLEKLVVAYEPIWAIGTGRAATSAQANETIGAIRRVIGELFGAEPAGGVRIQYGGSVTPANAAELFAQPEIDGALVGGASLKAPDFISICEAAAKSGL
jgi:triosephosphate isomerase (TIM)